MKNNSRKILILAIALSVGVFVSGKAVAVVSNSQDPKINENRREARAEMRAGNQEHFCEGLSERLDDLKDKVSEAAERIRNRKRDRLKNWEENQDKRDAKLAEFRSLRDANLEEHFRMLEERAQSEEQKKAVADFKEAVKKAIGIRRDAIDLAIDTFRSGAKEAIDGHKGDLEGLAGEYQSAQEAAFEKAKSDCAKGTSPQTVRNTLRTSLKAAQEKFLSGRKNSEKVGTTMEALIQARKLAIEKAISNFKASMEEAKSELKKAFPEG